MTLPTCTCTGKRHAADCTWIHARAGLPVPQPQTSSPPPRAASAATTAALAAPAYRSKTEARYAEVLRWREADKQISHFWYEPFSLRLGADLFYRPDFMIALHESPLLTLVEVKGSWIRDRALDKPKAAASRFPCFVFLLAVWDRQTWTETRIQAHL